MGVLPLDKKEYDQIDARCAQLDAELRRMCAKLSKNDCHARKSRAIISHDALLDHLTRRPFAT